MNLNYNKEIEEFLVETKLFFSKKARRKRVHFSEVAPFLSENLENFDGFRVKKLSSPIRILRRPLERDLCAFLSELISCDEGELGKKFIRRWLEIIKNSENNQYKITMIEKILEDFSNSKFTCELESEEVENIDILIQSKKSLLGIEVKLPGYKESHIQTIREQNAIEEFAKINNQEHFVGLFLTPSQDDPSEQKFCYVSISTLKAAIKDILFYGKDETQSLKNLKIFSEILHVI